MSIHGGYSAVPLPNEEEVAKLWDERLQAKRERRFADADELKKKMEEMGVNVNWLDRLYSGPLRR